VPKEAVNLNYEVKNFFIGPAEYLKVTLEIPD
jgi:hypothetical protein